ncbi:MAG: hypothetical protein WCA44_09255 [Acidobacteriaceae bacterium]
MNRTTGHPMPEVVLRTRRSVMEAAQIMRSQRQQRKRQMGFILLAVAVLVMLAAPALWSAFSDLAAGEELTDMPLMMLTLSLVLLTAMFAVLLVSWRGGRGSTNQDPR